MRTHNLISSAIGLFVLPSKSPKLNGAVERAHQTHTEEFYEVYDCSWNISELTKELRQWEYVYNWVRSHSKILGQPVVVVNKPGGGSSVMLGELKTKKPDGYTLGIIPSAGVLIAHLRKVPYHPINDFDPILQYSVYQYGLVVKADVPWKTLKDLIAHAQANPNRVKYSTAGAGSTQHLLMIQLGEVAKVKWTHIPYGSGMEAVTALLGGHVDFCPQTTEWKPHVDAGRLRLLAILNDKRMDSYPDVPTLIEQGYNLAASSAIGIVGPKGLPKDRKKLLYEAFFKGSQDAAFKNSLKQFDLPLFYRNTEEFGKFLKELYESSGKLIEKMEKK